MKIYQPIKHLLDHGFSLVLAQGGWAVALSPVPLARSTRPPLEDTCQTAAVDERGDNGDTCMVRGQCERGEDARR